MVSDYPAIERLRQADMNTTGLIVHCINISLYDVAPLWRRFGVLFPGLWQRMDNLKRYSVMQVNGMDLNSLWPICYKWINSPMMNAWVPTSGINR